MSEVARLPFGSPDSPAEQGALVLDDSGTVWIEPSEDLRDALAQREEEALTLSDRWGTRLGLGLVALGLAALAGGWAAGRIFGKSAGQMIAPRSVQHVSLRRTSEGCLEVQLGHTVWTSDTCSASEAEQFQKLLEEMKTHD